MTKKFYVYYVTIEDVIVYIGKGNGNRYKHALSGISSVKAFNRLYVLNELHTVKCERLKWYYTSDEALVDEAKFIDEFKPAYNIRGKNENSAAYYEADILKYKEQAEHINTKRVSNKPNFNKIAKEYCFAMAMIESPEEDHKQQFYDKVNELLTYSDQLRKYHGVISPQNITSASYSMKKLDEMYDNITILRRIKDNPFNLEVNKTYTCDEIRTHIEKLFLTNQVTKIPKLTEMKNWYEYKPSTIMMNGNRTHAIKIIEIKKEPK